MGKFFFFARAIVVDWFDVGCVLEAEAGMGGGGKGGLLKEAYVYVMEKRYSIWKCVCEERHVISGFIVCEGKIIKNY